MRVVLTDHPWSDVELEREILEAAGFELIAHASSAGSVEEIERLVSTSNPAAVLTCWAPVSERAVEQTTNLRIVILAQAGIQ